MCVENGDHRPPCSSIPWTSSKFLQERKRLSWLSGEGGTVVPDPPERFLLVPLTKAETLLCVFMLGACVHMGVAEEESGWES